jgi:thiol:disulfide interchange protein
MRSKLPMLEPSASLASASLASSRSSGLGWTVALTCGLLIGLTSVGVEAQSGPRPGPKAQIEAFADRTAYAPGAEARIAVRFLVAEGWHLQSHTPSAEWLIPTVLTITPPEGWSVGDIVYPPHELWQASFQTELLAVYEGESFIEATLHAGASAVSGVASVVLNYQACDDQVCLPPGTAETQLLLEVGAAGAATHTETFARARTGLAGDAARPRAARGGLGTTILLALLGGLILNAMPCVLPVLSLKVFGLVREAGSGTRAVTAGALATAAGILVSFWGLALAAIATRAAGNAVGWGIQFQNPGFVAFLVVILMFFAFNMWGLFEVQLPSSVIGLGAKPRGGYAGHFGAGLFATLMATPCSAPFLGTAVGYALSQTAVTILLLFSAIGAGMALPYLAVAAAPRAVGWLPKPGAWMETLKGVMGFLLAGTAIWLLYVLNAQVSAVSLALFEAALLILGLFAWLRGRATPHSGRARVGTIAMLLWAIVAITFAARAEARGVLRPATSRLDWRPFEWQAAQDLAAAGRLVFVDVTADWCATCKVNEQLVLETDAVVELFARHEVIAMRADWTNRDDAIAQFLEHHGRYAIPFYALYRPDDEPYVFGELLTRARVVAAVESSDRRPAKPRPSPD